MACCLRAPSHCFNQYWFKGLWHSPESIFTVVIQAIILHNTTDTGAKRGAFQNLHQGGPYPHGIYIPNALIRVSWHNHVLFFTLITMMIIIVTIISLSSFSCLYCRVLKLFLMYYMLLNSLTTNFFWSEYLWAFVYLWTFLYSDNTEADGICTQKGNNWQCCSVDGYVQKRHSSST